MKHVLNKKSVCFFLVLSLLFAVMLVYYSKKKEQDDSIKPNIAFRNITETIVPTEIIPLPDSKFYPPGCGFTCTGLTYDRTAETFWCANYGKEFPEDETLRPSILNISGDFSQVLQEIDLTGADPEDGIQGITWDEKDNVLWVCIGSEIASVNTEGEVLRSFNLSEFAETVMPTGILYDSVQDDLIVLCYHNYIFRCEKNGRIKEALSCNYYAQDQLCWIKDNIAFTVGADYNGKNNFLAVYDEKTQKVNKAFRLKNSYAVEGAFYKDGYLYVLNDGLFHDARIKKNYVAVYKLEE